jgi:hypothetical protein
VFGTKKTSYNHTILVGIDDTTGEVLGVVDGWPSPGSVSNGVSSVAVALLVAGASVNGHYNNANTSTPYVDTLSTPEMCDLWDALVNYANNFPKALYGGWTSNSNSLTSYLWTGFLGQSQVGPPPGPQSTPGWNGPIFFVE